MASHNAHENRRGDDGRPSHAAQSTKDSQQPQREEDPRDGLPSVGRGLDEDTGGDTISGFDQH
jgi:hypothetical protein